MIPPTATVRDTILLSVTGKDGVIYHATVDLARASPATAHYLTARPMSAPTTATKAAFPVLACWYDKQDVDCDAVWTSGGAHVPDLFSTAVQMRDYEGNIIASAVPFHSRVTFTKPEKPFYIRYESSFVDSTTFEVDSHEIDATRMLPPS